MPNDEKYRQVLLTEEGGGGGGVPLLFMLIRRWNVFPGKLGILGLLVVSVRLSNHTIS